MQYATPIEPQRTSLRRFEHAYARWCAATEALAAAELRLWVETLRDPDAEGLGALADEVLRLREAAQEAHRAMPGSDEGVHVPHPH